MLLDDVTYKYPLNRQYTININNKPYKVNNVADWFLTSDHFVTIFLITKLSDINFITIVALIRFLTIF